MLLFPNCKINLGLHILRKRENGFHDLETVFYPLPLQDALEIVQAPLPTTDIEFNTTGLLVDGAATDNICVKAYHLLKKKFPALPAVSMHLHKVIPMGAGLGGGSADGAFTLVLLNKKFNLQLGEEELLAYALQLGSDCPFFIKNTPCYATGRGENLQAINLDLSTYTFVVVYPSIHINTGWAFSQITPSAHRPSLLQLIQEPIEQWKHGIENDFEGAVFSHHSQIKKIKEQLYQSGALYAAMTGSGSTVFGIYVKGYAPKLSLPGDYFVKTI